MRPEEISRAILQGNAKLLESIKGIGRSLQSGSFWS